VGATVLSRAVQCLIAGILLLGGGLAAQARDASRAPAAAPALVVAQAPDPGQAAGTPDAPGTATSARTPSPKGAEVYFHYPIDGIRVPQRMTVRIGLRGMGVAPAGVAKPLTGHHHLLIDAEDVDLDRPIPNDYNHIHLGNGQTEVVITLQPGRHTLQLLVGDHLHIPHVPPVMSKKITVYVR
jgi:hypothetical protein